MGNVNTSASDQALSFLIIFIATYGVAAAVAIRAHALMSNLWIKCGRNKKLAAELRAEAPSVDHPAERAAYMQHYWYLFLNKTKGFPGSWVYVFFWSVMSFLSAYTAWRIWINVPARHDVYGIVFIALFIFQIIINGLASEALYGVKSIPLSLVFWLLAVASAAAALAMLGLLTFQTSLLPSITLFVIQCVYTAGILVPFVCVCILCGKNRKEYDEM